MVSAMKEVEASYKEGAAMALLKEQPDVASSLTPVAAVTVPAGVDGFGEGAATVAHSPGFLFPEGAQPGTSLNNFPKPVPLKKAGDSPSDSVKKDACASLWGKSLGEWGWKLQQKLLEVIPLRSQSTGKGSRSAIFPLPTSTDVFVALDSNLSQCEISWIACVCISLNSSWGEDLLSSEMPKGGRLKCVLKLLEEVKKFCKLQQPVEEVSWKKYLRVKSIDYKGDEVQVARWFQWGNVSPALPGEVGVVPLEEVCSLGCRDYVLNFDQYLKPKEEWKISKAPRVMVEDSLWGEVCTGLVASKVCVFIEESEVFDTGHGPLLNGMFGVTKEDFTPDGTEIFRLIMNLIPLNGLCMPITGDVNTLPAWSGMSPFFLQPTESLVVTSEDVKCFFYTMAVPECWIKYLAFNKAVPNDCLPPHLSGRRVYLASRVLPMSFLNSVSLAQHVHRNLVQWGSIGGESVNTPESEIRKDLAFTSGSSSWRVYLDNYDLLERVASTQVTDLEGTQALGVLALRSEYEKWQVPRNEKKAVSRSTWCEVQGATVDGDEGRAFPREQKLGKYFALGFLLAEDKWATQKQWQIACGGMVYFTMFRRPLLGTLNRVRSHIESFNQPWPFFRETPPDCTLELVRFLGLLPLARMDFRLDMHGLVTCSDASEHGGGACVSTGTTFAWAIGGNSRKQPDCHHWTL